MAMYGALSKTKEFKRYEETMDIETLLKMQRG
jgi:hypothetical protein